MLSWPKGHRIGEVADLLLDQAGRYVVGIVVRSGLWGTGQRVVPLHHVRAADWQGIVVDAIDGALGSLSEQATWGQQRDLTGKRLLTQTGRELGQFDDVVFDARTGLVTNYRLSAGFVSDLLDGRQRVAGSLEAVAGDHVIIGVDSTGNGEIG